MYTELHKLEFVGEKTGREDYNLLSSLLGLPYLPTVNDILPQNIATRTNRRQRRQIGGGYPYSKCSVLLTQCLTGINRLVEARADSPAAPKLKQTQHERAYGNDEQKSNACVGMQDVLHSCARHYQQRASPKIIRKVFYGSDALAYTLCVMLYDVGKNHRHNKHGEHLI